MQIAERPLGARVAPRPILGCHAHHEGLDLCHHGPSGPAPVAAVVLAGDEPLEAFETTRDTEPSTEAHSTRTANACDRFGRWLAITHPTREIRSEQPLIGSPTAVAGRPWEARHDIPHGRDVPFSSMTWRDR